MVLFFEDVSNTSLLVGVAGILAARWWELVFVELADRCADPC